MDYKIEERPGFRAVGIKGTFNFTNGDNLENIPKMWGRAMEDRTFHKIMELNDSEPQAALGVITMASDTEIYYYIAASSKKDIPEGMVEVIVAPAMYAVFPCKISEIQDVTKHIFSEWLPSSDYEHADAPEIELYLNEHNCEILIPIKK